MRLEEDQNSNSLVTAKSELLGAVKGRERSTIPSIYAQRLFMGHQNNVATCVEELGCTKTYRRSERVFQRGQEFQTKYSGPGSIGAVGRCEGEGKVHHSFNICPKALHGSPKQCCNMRRRIGKDQNIQEESEHVSKRPRVPNLAQVASELLVAVKGREMSTIPSIYAQR